MRSCDCACCVDYSVDGVGLLPVDLLRRVHGRRHGGHPGLAAIRQVSERENWQE